MKAKSVFESRGLITFDRSCAEDILSVFDIKLDCDGYLMYTKSGKKVLTEEGEPILLKEFAGVRKKGRKLVFLKNDLPSLIRLLDDLKEELTR